MPTIFSQKIIQRTKAFSDACNRLECPQNVAVTYNPLDYAFRSHARFLELYATGRKKVLFLGMNPGPWGMAQTGIPFGEVDAVKNWLRIEESVSKPALEHPARPVMGFACSRSEVSGRRLWGLFADLFGSADAFFTDHFILNYCPLSFMSETGANITPDKLPAHYRKELNQICDEFLTFCIDQFQPDQLIGIGGYATKCFQNVTPKSSVRKIATLLHPSPASPIANKEWPKRPIEQLKALGVLPDLKHTS